MYMFTWNMDIVHLKRDNQGIHVPLGNISNMIMHTVEFSVPCVEV